MNLSDITFRENLLPGDLGRIIGMHGTIYSAEYGWDHTFEAYVAGPLSEFAKAPGKRQRLWIAEADGKIVGMIAIVEATKITAQLRWFLVCPEARGIGLGRELLQKALAFAKEQEFRTVFLWTVHSLSRAGELYAKNGFQITAREKHALWGSEVTEERYELALARPLLKDRLNLRLSATEAKNV
jgi:N-acetylglutamate synthase-like GNAT family acetyltransferase